MSQHLTGSYLHYLQPFKTFFLLYHIPCQTIFWHMSFIFLSGTKSRSFSVLKLKCPHNIMGVCKFSKLLMSLLISPKMSSLK